MYPGSGDKNRTESQPTQKSVGGFSIATCDAGFENTSTCSIELPADPPEWVHLMTPGQMLARDGREFHLANVSEVVKNSLARTANLVIDYEHQTDHAEKNGQPAPAAGWIKDLAVRADGIWGRVEWNAKAADMIREREYRFLSPTFTHSKTKPHTVGLILRAALTNNPALELTALATTQDGDPDMEFLKALAKALGLSDTATEDEILTALTKSLERTTALAAIATASRAALKLAEDADEKAITAAIGELAESVATASAKGDPDPAQFVPIAQVTALTTRVAELEAGASEDKAAAAVEKAMTSRKVPPSMKDWATSYAQKDLEGFIAYCEKQPVIFQEGSDVPSAMPVGDGKLSDAEKAICKATGVSEEAFLKTREAELEAA